MSSSMKCSHCLTEFVLAEGAAWATCPQCCSTFAAARPEVADLIASLTAKKKDASTVAKRARDTMVSKRPRRNADEEEALAARQRIWGIAAFFLAALALLSAPLFGARPLTVALAALGIGAGLVGLFTRGGSAGGRFLPTLGSALSGLVLTLVFLAPRYLSSYWAMSFDVPEPDMNAQEYVARDWPMKKGRTPTADDWADAVNEAVRQQDVLVRLDSVSVAALGNQSAKKYLLIHYRLGNPGHGMGLKYAGFGHAAPPLLTDEAGRSYPFIEQRRRNLKAGPPPTFVPWQPQEVYVPPGRFVDFQLIFEAPSLPLPALKLELPAAAWGRSGQCKLRITGLFEAELPEAQTRKGNP
jgi:hypothetical protein